MMMMKMRQRCRSLFCSNYTLYRAAFGCGVPTTTTPPQGETDAPTNFRVRYLTNEGVSAVSAGRVPLG